MTLVPTSPRLANLRQALEAEETETFGSGQVVSDGV